MRAPFRGAVVTYHDRGGVIRYAVVTHTLNTLDEVAVKVGALPPIADRMHCHLDVYQHPGGYEAAYNVAHGDQPGQWTWPL